MYNPLYFDVFLGFAVGCIIYVQWLTINVMKKRLDKTHRNIQALAKYKTGIDHKHDYKLMAGDLEMEHLGRKAKVKAAFHLKKVI